MKIYKPPTKILDLDFDKTIFLAGSIEEGKADDWQKKLETALKDDEGTILNPRRDDWDSSWIQSKDNKEFRNQVEWELFGLEHCTIIVMFFQPGTKSPISLLELGLHAKSEKLIVCCPKGYMKKGNVDVTCDYYEVPVVETFEKLIESIKLIVT
jgi:hypothetical protein